MSLASRIANIFAPSQTQHFTQGDGHHTSTSENASNNGAQEYLDNITRQRTEQEESIMEKQEEEEGRPPYIHSMLAGGIGGTTGDLLMHSLDTVKTRQQGDTHFPPRYPSMSSSYSTIFRQEGFRKGLYSGVTPAFLGSFPGTVIFFGTYEYSKRHLIDAGVHNSLAYLAGGRKATEEPFRTVLTQSGFIADFAASFVYVPSEVLKTRLQLQGRYNNPFFVSGYNYRSTIDAARTIIRLEGISALFYGYKATIFRDLPFSALQFAFYEQERKWSKQWVGGNDIGVALEVATATTAGGMAGVITCPLDVVKTRIQTQLNPLENMPPASTMNRRTSDTSSKSSPAASSRKTTGTLKASSLSQQVRPLSAVSPNTGARKPGSVMLDTSSVTTGLKLIFRTEGIAGLFRGVGPRLVWTSVQSGTMLVLYQALLKQFEAHPLVYQDEGVGIV